MDAASVEIGAFTIIPQAFMLVVFLFAQIYVYRILRGEQMFSQIWQRIKELIIKVLGTSKSVEQALHIKPTVSIAMSSAIDLWGYMYQNKAPWLKEPSPEDPARITSLGLPAFIASEKARMCTLEMKSEITGQMKTNQKKDNLTGLMISENIPVGDTSRAEYLNEQYQNTIMKDIRTQLEYGLAKGGLVIKPYVIAGEKGMASRIVMDYVQADGFYPISFDVSGRMTEAAFIQKIVDKEYTYSRLEYHKLQGMTVTVINKAYRTINSTSTADYDITLGEEIPLTSVPDWAALEPETTVENVDRLLFAYFKVPIANTIDTYSPLGVSVYSRAKDLIKDADMQYSRLLWEFEGSELAVDVDRDALNVELDEDGRPINIPTALQNRLYRKLDLGDESLREVFSPSIRDNSLLNGLNNILMHIEDVCELARGTLANVNQEARTATEIAVLKQRSYAANAQLQKSLEDTLKDVVYVMNVYTTLYKLAPEGEYDVSFEWDDSIQVDKESEMAKRLTLVQNGLSSKIEFRMWYYGETEEQAVQALSKIQAYNEYEAQSSLQTTINEGGIE